MLTENDIDAAFRKTNKAEPLCEGWPGLLRFGREVERITALDMERDLYLRIGELEDSLDALASSVIAAAFRASHGSAEKKILDAALADLQKAAGGVYMAPNVQIEGLAATKRERSPESSKNRRPQRERLSASPSPMQG